LKNATPRIACQGLDHYHPGMGSGILKKSECLQGWY
jgi:hypothetical protein